MLDEAPTLRYVSCSQATLLGSPIGGQECFDHTIFGESRHVGADGESSPRPLIS